MRTISEAPDRTFDHEQNLLSSFRKCVQTHIINILLPFDICCAIILVREKSHDKDSRGKFARLNPFQFEIQRIASVKGKRRFQKGQFSRMGKKGNCPIAANKPPLEIASRKAATSQLCRRALPSSPSPYLDVMLTAQTDISVARATAVSIQRDLFQSFLSKQLLITLSERFMEPLDEGAFHIALRQIKEMAITLGMDPERIEKRFRKWLFTNRVPDAPTIANLHWREVHAISEKWHDLARIGVRYASIATSGRCGATTGREGRCSGSAWCELWDTDT